MFPLIALPEFLSEYAAMHESAALTGGVLGFILGITYLIIPATHETHTHVDRAYAMMGLVLLASSAMSLIFGLYFLALVMIFMLVELVFLVIKGIKIALGINQ